MFTSSTLRAAEPSAELVEPIRDSARDLPFPGVNMLGCPEPLDGGLVTKIEFKIKLPKYLVYFKINLLLKILYDKYLDSCWAAAAAVLIFKSAFDNRDNIFCVLLKSGSIFPNGGGLEFTTSPPGPFGVT